MKKTSIFLALTLLLLTACGGVNTEAVNPDQAAIDDGSQIVEVPAPVESEPRPVSGINTLLIGTFMLEGTENAVTAAQADELLPLWKLTQNLIGSGTAADAEIQAVAGQIQRVMTDAQVAIITEGEYTAQDMFTLLDEIGISITTTDVKVGGDASTGGGPGTGQRPGAGGVPGGGELTEEQQAEVEARRAAGGGRTGFLSNPAVFEALIALLEAKIE